MSADRFSAELLSSRSTLVHPLLLLPLTFLVKRLENSSQISRGLQRQVALAVRLHVSHSGGGGGGGGVCVCRHVPGRCGNSVSAAEPFLRLGLTLSSPSDIRTGPSGTLSLVTGQKCKGGGRSARLPRVFLNIEHHKLGFAWHFEKC